VHKLPKASEYTSPAAGRQTKAARDLSEGAQSRAPAAIHRPPVDTGDKPPHPPLRPPFSLWKTSSAWTLRADGPRRGCMPGRDPSPFSLFPPEKPAGQQPVHVCRRTEAAIPGTAPSPTERNALSPVSPLSQTSPAIPMKPATLLSTAVEDGVDNHDYSPLTQRQQRRNEPASQRKATENAGADRRRRQPFLWKGRWASLLCWSVSASRETVCTTKTK
jgi:hypothetical protein